MSGWPCLSGFSGKKECRCCKAAVRPGSASTPAFLVVQGDGVELQPVVDQPIAELARDLRLQPLDFLRLEFDHLASAQIDQMIVMRLRHLFIARAPVTEVV